MRQFEVLTGKRVQLKEGKNNCFTGFFVYLHVLVLKLIPAEASYSAFFMKNGSPNCNLLLCGAPTFPLLGIFHYISTSQISIDCFKRVRCLS